MHSSIDTIRLNFVFIKGNLNRRDKRLGYGAKMRIQEEVHVLKRMKSKSWYEYRGIHACACSAQSKTLQCLASSSAALMTLFSFNLID